MTPPERKLWHRLNQRQQDGIKFRRQAAIGPFIADFLSHDVKIVIELDGDTHGSDTQSQRDDSRASYLESEGFRVIRFSNAEVRESLDEVVRRIRLACGLPEFPA
jgi:very-short-patch-repair endonuclease